MAKILIFLIISCVYASELVDKTKEAGMIQTGLNTYVSNFITYTKNQVKNIGIEDEVMICYMGYKIFKNKELVIPINEKQQLTINLNSATILVRF